MFLRKKKEFRKGTFEHSVMSARWKMALEAKSPEHKVPVFAVIVLGFATVAALNLHFEWFLF